MVFVGLAALALLIHVVGLSRQANTAMIGLVLPPAVAMLMLARRAKAT